MKNIGEINMERHYTVIYLKKPIHVPEYVDKINWLEDYEGKGAYALGGWSVFFEQEEDASMFLLRFGVDVG